MRFPDGNFVRIPHEAVKRRDHRKEIKPTFWKLTFILARGWLFSLFSSSILSDVPKLVSRTGRGKTYTDELFVDSVLGLEKF